MAICIKFGKWIKAYKYILLLIISRLLQDFSFGSDVVENFKDYTFFNCGDLSKSYHIHQIFCYFLTLIIAFFLYKKEYDYLKRNSLDYNFKKMETKIAQAQTLDIELIHNEQELIVYPDKFLFIIILLWVINEQTLIHSNTIFIRLDFWMLELIIITFFMHRMLNLKIYSHQKLVLYLSSIPFILKIITIIFSFMDVNNHLDENEKDNYIYSKDVEDKLKLLYVSIPWLTGIGVPISIGLIVLRAYIHTKLKWLIDLRYISVYKILIIYSSIGIVISIIISLISTFISCGVYENEKGKKSLSDYFCKVQYDNNTYIENFKAYIFSSATDNQKIQEMLSVLLGVASFCGYKFFFLRIIEYLTPVHWIFALPIYYLCNKSYLCILNLIKNGTPFEEINYVKEKLILDFCSDIFAIFGFLVYLEIIELRFCGLDYNLRRKILIRGDKDKKKADLNDSNNSNFSNFSINNTGDENIINGRDSSGGQLTSSSINDSDI